MAFKFAQLFGSSTSAAAANTPSTASASAVANHRQVSRMALRDTLRQHGIPEAWVGMDTLVRGAHSQEPRLDIRLVVRHWEKDLIVHSMALQQDFKRRLNTLDPLSQNWMSGVFWQYALPDDAQYASLPVARTPPEKSKPTLKQRVAACVDDGGETLVRPDREILLRMFDEPHDQLPGMDRAYASTVPAALH